MASARIYVEGDAHTQTIERFWSLVKRGIGGVYHSVSAKWLLSYLDEDAWRYNNREHTPRGTGNGGCLPGKRSSGYYWLGLPFGPDGFAPLEIANEVTPLRDRGFESGLRFLCRLAFAQFGLTRHL